MNTPVHTLLSDPPALPAKTWFARNWKWFVPVTIVSAVLLFGLFIAGVFELATSIMRSSEVYKTAVQRAEASPMVAEKIGHPLQFGWLTQGNINWSGETGDAELSIPISGPRGEGHILLSAKRQHGRWVFQTLEVDVDGEDTSIPLLNPAISEPSPAENPV